MHPVSYNHSAAVLLTPTRSFLVLFGTGMHWRRIHYFSRVLMPSRTTSALTCHVITSIFSLITFTRRKRGLPSRCALVFSHKVTLLTEDEDEDDWSLISAIGKRTGGLLRFRTTSLHCVNFRMLRLTLTVILLTLTILLWRLLHFSWAEISLAGKVPAGLVESRAHEGYSLILLFCRSIVLFAVFYAFHIYIPQLHIIPLPFVRELHSIITGVG